MLLVSACLAGVLCKYNGADNTVPAIKKLVAEGRTVAVCPEVLGGAAVPREPNEIAGGNGFDVLEGRCRVTSPSGQDATALFVDGAQKVLQIAREKSVDTAILKERSPSCGSSVIYNGTFSGKKVGGMGVTAALLHQNGIRLYSEENCGKHFIYPT